MPKWNNPSLSLYHGTDSASATKLKTVTVNLALCKPSTDFGQGYYMTTNRHQAEQWANNRVLRSISTKAGLQAAVLKFDIDRNWMSNLETLTFVRPTTDFWNLVSDCRSGFPPHQRQSPHQRCYDVVFGPVTLWAQTLVIADCDQISFHTHRAVSGLRLPSQTFNPRNGKRYF